MRQSILVPIVSALLFVGGCDEQANSSHTPTNSTVTAAADKILIRSIRFVGTATNYGIELNGGRGFVHWEQDGAGRAEISAEEVSALIDEFYSIPGIEGYRGRKSDSRRSDLQYLVAVHDEAEGRRSEEYVDYVIPKISVEVDSPLHRWLTNMQDLKDRTKS